MSAQIESVITLDDNGVARARVISARNALSSMPVSPFVLEGVSTLYSYKERV
jgi:hypothetical protein